MNPYNQMNEKLSIKWLEFKVEILKKCPMVERYIVVEDARVSISSCSKSLALLVGEKGDPIQI